MNDLVTLVTAEACHLLDQALKKIENCLDQLDDQQVWHRSTPQTNSIGNLLLHLEGNLRQWALAGIQGLPDHRNRDREFDPKNEPPGEQLWNQLKKTVHEAQETFHALELSDLLAKKTIQGFPVTVYEAISHTTTHFVGHSHQIIMLTRMQLGDRYQFQWSPDSDRGKVPI